MVCLDADTVFEPQTIAELVAPLRDPTVGAVAGNAKVGNRLNLVTRWQALEYVTSQNVDRRAFDLLNCITVVPGAVGAWRRTAVLEASYKTLEQKVAKLRQADEAFTATLEAVDGQTKTLPVSRFIRLYRANDMSTEEKWSIYASRWAEFITGQPREFTEMGEGGRTACAGPVYYCGVDVEKTNGFPQHFSCCLLFWDWERPALKWARLDAGSNLVGIEPFTSASNISSRTGLHR